MKTVRLNVTMEVNDYWTPDYLSYVVEQTLKRGFDSQVQVAVSDLEKTRQSEVEALITSGVEVPECTCEKTDPHAVNCKYMAFIREITR